MKTAFFSTRVVLIRMQSLTQRIPPFQARIGQFRDIPRWQGESGEGKTLLVWTDQGLGDTLMMMRYLPATALSRASRSCSKHGSSRFPTRFLISTFRTSLGESGPRGLRVRWGSPCG